MDTSLIIHKKLVWILSRWEIKNELMLKNLWFVTMVADTHPVRMEFQRGNILTGKHSKSESRTLKSGTPCILPLSIHHHHWWVSASCHSCFIGKNSACVITVERIQSSDSLERVQRNSHRNPISIWTCATSQPLVSNQRWNARMDRHQSKTLLTHGW